MIPYRAFSVEKYWYGQHALRYCLYPFSLLYRGATAIRRVCLTRFRQQHYPVPIIVVGNITVGGVGKTPLVIELARQCSARGLKVGIVSRGYGARVNRYPYRVKAQDTANKVGDEPKLIAKHTGCPVVIAPKRTQAVQYLLDHCQSQIIISDDGLQHYAMGRAIEIVVVDGQRQFGNGLCLPAGPLREGVSRLLTADFIVVNGGELNGCSRLPPRFRMDLTAGALTQINSGTCLLADPKHETVAAVAGIGNPQRFYATLQARGIPFRPYSFADHHHYVLSDLCLEEKMVVMTEKDAVKCQQFASNNMYFLPVEATVEDEFWTRLWKHKGLQGYV